MEQLRIKPKSGHNGLYRETKQEELTRLVRRMLHLLDCAPQASRSSANREEAPEVLFELRVDGFRYKLTRCFDTAPEDEVNLSPREKEIVRLVAKGHPNKTIAAILDISKWTVATHLRRIFNKLQVNSRAAMIVRVMEIGGIDPVDLDG